jgi:hypothetical protein
MPLRFEGLRGAGGTVFMLNQLQDQQRKCALANSKRRLCTAVEPRGLTQQRRTAFSSPCMMACACCDVRVTSRPTAPDGATATSTSTSPPRCSVGGTRDADAPTRLLQQPSDSLCALSQPPLCARLLNCVRLLQCCGGTKRRAAAWWRATFTTRGRWRR